MICNECDLLEICKYTDDCLGTKKALAEHDKHIIDEFFNNIKKYCRTSSCIGCRFCNDETCEIAVIKEQLKGAEE